MNCILFEDAAYSNFLPLTFTRPVFELRIGIDTIREKWIHFLDSSCEFYTRNLFPEYSLKTIPKKDSLWINARVLPDSDVLAYILALENNRVLLSASGEIIASRGEVNPAGATEEIKAFKSQTYDGNPIILQYLPDIFRYNGQAIRSDFERICKGRTSAQVEDPHTRVYNPGQIFIEPGVKIRAAILNAESGPIYIGPNAEIQEGAIIHGTHAICANAVVNMGAKLRGDSTIGTGCKVGGEVSNTVFHSYSNKGHDGFIGNSVIGSWCNLGADSNTSNLKNNYADVKIWNYDKQKFLSTGLMFCGLIMGDHSKCGINTMFNTGTVVGVGANVFGDGFPRNFIPDFSWGGAAGFTTHSLNKAIETAGKVMERRNLKLSEADLNVLEHTFNLTAPFRNWEDKTQMR